MKYFYSDAFEFRSSKAKMKACEFSPNYYSILVFLCLDHEAYILVILVFLCLDYFSDDIEQQAMPPCHNIK